VSDLPKWFPISKFKLSPKKAANESKISNNSTLKNECGRVAIEPHRNNKESPGKNGIITSPVSHRIIKKMILYATQLP
jgi:hypothetical protein